MIKLCFLNGCADITYQCAAIINSLFNEFVPQLYNNEIVASIKEATLGILTLKTHLSFFDFQKIISALYA